MNISDNHLKEHDVFCSALRSKQNEVNLFLHGSKATEGNSVPEGPIFHNQIEKKLLTAQEASLLLGCSAKTLYAWAKTNKLPCIQLGRLVRFKSVDIEALISGKRRLF